jgi:hypothetical protein
LPISFSSTRVRGARGDDEDDVRDIALSSSESRRFIARAARGRARMRRVVSRPRGRFYIEAFFLGDQSRY